MSADGALIVVGSTNGFMRLWDFSTTRPIDRPQKELMVRSPPSLSVSTASRSRAGPRMGR